MVEPLRHRQTKGAATDMFYLMPPRHISTLRKVDVQPSMSNSGEEREGLIFEVTACIDKQPKLRGFQWIEAFLW